MPRRGSTRATASCASSGLTCPRRRPNASDARRLGVRGLARPGWWPTHSGARARSGTKAGCASRAFGTLPARCGGAKGDGAKAQYDERGLSSIVQGIAADAVKRGVQVRFCIEDVAAAPGQGVVSMFKFGIGYGLWLGAISMTAFPLIKAKPQTWQRVAFAGRPQADKKQTSFLVARELFPELPLKSKSADSGLSDAALIAMACARLYTPRKETA